MPQVKDFAELSASVAQLSRRVARVTGSPGALSDTDKALAAAQVRCLAFVRGVSGLGTAGISKALVSAHLPTFILNSASQSS